MTRQDLIEQLTVYLHQLVNGEGVSGELSSPEDVPTTAILLLSFPPDAAGQRQLVSLDALNTPGMSAIVQGLFAQQQLLQTIATRANNLTTGIIALENMNCVTEEQDNHGYVEREPSRDDSFDEPTV